jgi:hypothetical protein
MAEARLAYAAARVHARHSRRPGGPQWGALDASRTPQHFLAALRSGGWLRVPEAVVAADPERREHWLRQAWRDACDEVARWYPPRWRPALDWLAMLPDLESLERMRDGTPAPAGLDADARADAERSLGVLAAADPAESLRDAWRRRWHALLPGDTDARRYILALDAAVARAATLGTTARRETLERAAQRTLRRAGTSAAAGFAWLLLVALQLERVRGGLASRSLPTGSAA